MGPRIATIKVIGAVVSILNKGSQPPYCTARAPEYCTVPFGNPMSLSRADRERSQRAHWQKTDESREISEFEVHVASPPDLNKLISTPASEASEAPSVDSLP